MRISGGRLHLGMAEQLPDHREALAQGQGPRRIRVPQVVDSDAHKASARPDALTVVGATQQAGAGLAASDGNWRHDVIVEDVRDGDPEMEYPAFVDGARRCPPEDVGGADGFMDFLESVLDSVHEEHWDMVRWDGEAFDPIGFDEARARFDMENWEAAARSARQLQERIAGSKTTNAACRVARGVDAGAMIELRSRIVRRRQRKSGTVQTLKKSAFG